VTTFVAINIKGLIHSRVTFKKRHQETVPFASLDKVPKLPR